MRPALLRPVSRLTLMLFAGLALIGGAALVYGLLRLELGPADPANDRMVLVDFAPGGDTGAFGRRLKDLGLIRSSFVFSLYARYLRMDSHLKSGSYEFSPSMPPGAILARLAAGETAADTFTIPEGFTVVQVADLLTMKGLADREQFLRLVRDPAFRPQYLPAAVGSSEAEAAAGIREPMEGYLFPDTYRIPKGLSAEEIIRLMTSRWEEVLTPELRARAAQLNLTLHQAVTLASIIEKEATAEDRDKVSAVFHNRLKIGMKLDSCATINYVLDHPRPVLTLADLETPSPYNTYRHSGLPPGPIANPGEAALRAALYPASVDYLYFVVQAPGKHAYAASYEEHLANRDRFQSALGPGNQP